MSVLDSRGATRSLYHELGNLERRVQQSFVTQPGSAISQQIAAQSYDHRYRYHDQKPRTVRELVLGSDPDGPDGPLMSFMHNENGNQTERTNAKGTRFISWNDDQQVQRVFQDGRLMSQSYYDGQGNRLVHFETNTTNNTLRTVAYVDDQLTITNDTKRSHHVMVNGERIASRAVGPGFDDAQIHWMHADPRGTVELETDSKGEVLSQIAYFPTGEFWHGGASGARGPPTFRFQGKELEGSTGLYAFGKRHYEPRLGLWLSPDPAFAEYFTSGLSGGMQNPRNLGLYSYVWNNPLRFVDPDGRRAQSIPHPMQILRAGMNSVGRWIDRAVEQAPHVVLQAAGLIPEIGELFDVADAALYAHEEEYGDAAMSMAATVPVGGWGLTLTRWLGKTGEIAAGIVKNTERIPSLSGTANYRVPDVLDHSQKLIGEVKNVKRLSFTRQLRDFSAYAKQREYLFELTVRRTTKLSRSLRDAVTKGDIILKYLP